MHRDDLVEDVFSNAIKRSFENGRPESSIEADLERRIAIIEELLDKVERS
jgi:hypothetical protein